MMMMKQQYKQRENDILWEKNVYFNILYNNDTFNVCVCDSEGKVF